MSKRWRLAALAAVAAAAVPAAALGAGHGFAVPPWMQRRMGHAPPELRRLMQTPQMRRMMESPPPGMEKMMQSPGMQRMGGGAAH